MLPQELVERRIADLRENSLSKQIYGDDDISDLLESIPAKGILVPLVIKPDGTIVSGHRRYRAVKRLFDNGAIKSEVIPCRVVSVEDELEEKDLIITYNESREKTDSQRMREAQVIKELVRAGARERKTSKLNIGNQAPLAKYFANGEQGEKTSDFLAKRLGFGSGRTFEKVEKVWTAAQAGNEEAKDLMGKLDRMEVSRDEAYQLIRREEKVKELKEKIEVVRSAPVSATNTLILGDCREQMKKLGDGSIALVLTDVPFFIPAEMGMHRRVNPMKFDPGLLAGSEELRGFDIFKSQEEYLAFTKEWVAEAGRVLKPGGHLVTFVDNHKVSDFIKMGESVGLVGRQCLYWLVSNPVPNADKRDFMSAVMSMVWLTKPTNGDSRPTFNYQLGQHPNYFEAPYVSGKERSLHPAQKPTTLLKEIISYLTEPGDVVLDPFAGSASTLVAAMELGRKPLGIEKSEFYYKVAAERLAAIDKSVPEGA